MGIDEKPIDNRSSNNRNKNQTDKVSIRNSRSIIEDFIEGFIEKKFIKSMYV